MTFLSKLESILVKVIGIVTGFVPLINPYLPQKAQAVEPVVVDKLQGIANAVITAGQMFTNAGIQKSGSQKLQAATPYVKQIVQSMELISGKKPKDEVLFEQGCTDITSGMAKVLNSFGD